MADTQAPPALQQSIDRCVKCGMCLPECPTYRLASDENESPRGRIALIDGLVRGRLRADAVLARHLDSCLGCRRCERVCPSLVPYGELIDAARARLSRDADPGPRLWLQGPGLQRWGTRLARLMPALLSRPLPALHRLHTLATALPAGQAAPAPGDYPAYGEQRGSVGLFLGCASAAQQGGALQAALQLLRHSGFRVSIPATAGCCGALSQHAGDTEGATARAAANRAAYATGLDAVVSIASGCGIHLAGYRPPLAAGHQDISRFLLDRGNLAEADFDPLPVKALVHTPCSMENVYRGGAWVGQLLALVPGLETVAIGEPGQCCGSAGDYMLRHPETAARLRAPLLAAVAGQDATLLLTSNIGCAMHIAAGLKEQGRNVEVLHPVELLARQLRARRHPQEA